MHKVAVGVLLLLLATPTYGQSTNLELFQEIAVACLDDVPATIDTVALEAPDRMPYLRSAIVREWQNVGRVVFLADSVRSYPSLAFDVEDARVRYERRGKRIARHVALALRFELTEPSGRILVDDRCAQQRSDVIPRSAIAAVEAPAYPETQADPPRAGWFRRFAEPIVVTAATAVAVYLFFSLRSTSSDES